MVNNVILQGRFVAAPELKQTQSGVAFCKFTIAWSEKYKEIETQAFLECQTWRQTAEFVSKYFHKGDMCVVEGKAVTQKWTDQNGQNHSKLICAVDKVHFCGAKSQNVTGDVQNGQDGCGGSYSAKEQNAPQNGNTSATGSSLPEFEIITDESELPF